MTQSAGVSAFQTGCLPPDTFEDTFRDAFGKLLTTKAAAGRARQIIIQFGTAIKTTQTPLTLMRLASEG
jgi:hypothetical protein